jgi:UDP-3-O-[3-hydroxymyristoyl] glucosamine N-acyltransferase
MFNLKEIAEKIDGILEGDASFEVKGLKILKEAEEDDLSFLTNQKYLKDAINSKAKAVLTFENVKIEGKFLIKHKDPYYALSKLIPFFYPPLNLETEFIANTFISKKAEIEKDVLMAPNVFVGPFCKIKKGTKIFSGVVLMGYVEIGENCIIYPNVSIYPRVKIGDNVIIQGGAVIGSDGFGFAYYDGKYHKIPQVGGVLIEDDVEIGSNTTIDCGTLSPTKIGKGTKIDNLVQIGHNVIIGKNCILTGQVGIAGSTEVGDGSMFGGQSGAVGHIKIGKNVKVSAKCGVTKDIPDGLYVSGFPSIPHNLWLKREALINKLSKGGKDEDR